MALGVSPYIITNGNGTEAVEFYERVLGAKRLSYATFGDMPYPGLKEEHYGLVMNAQLLIGQSVLMVSDNLPDTPYTIGNHLNIAVMVGSLEEAQNLEQELSVHGKVVMPVQAVPWSAGYGQVEDQFGVFWQINAINEDEQPSNL